MSQQTQIDLCNQNLKNKNEIALNNIPLTRITPISPYTSFTRSQLDMRRKIEILKHQNNASNTKTNNFTKKQQWSMLVNGITKNFSQSKVTENLENNNSECPLDDLIPTLSTASDIPGKPFLLQYDPTIPLYNYTKNVT